MSTVAWYEIFISIIILIGSTVGIGILSAKIYRVGVLLYGTPPKLTKIMKAKQGGLGIVSVLTIVFIVLKLLGVIQWSWIWVLSPIWISAVIVVAVFSVILIGGRIKKEKW